MMLPGLDASAQTVMNQSRLNMLGVNRGMERLGTGYKINRGEDDPSGLAIAKGMTAQIRGAATAIGNIQDGIYLIHTADAVLNEVQDMMLRIRDLAVRGANEASLWYKQGAAPGDDPFGPQRQIYQEIRNLQIEIFRSSNTNTGANGKEIFKGAYQNGQVIQVGPDNGNSYTTSITLPDLRNYGWPTYIPLPWNWTQANVTGFFQFGIDDTDRVLEEISDYRANLGILENRLQHALDDLTAQHINISAARSNIEDADMAQEISQLTANQIKTQSNLAAATQANALPEIVYQLLDSAGLGPGDTNR